MLTLPNVNKQYTHGNDKTAEIISYLKDNQEKFSRELIGDLSHIHHRTAVLSGINICDVSHCGQNNYVLDFSFDYVAHVGCGHTAHEDTEHQTISFKVGDSGEIGFDLLDFEERSTYEEF